MKKILVALALTTALLAAVIASEPESQTTAIVVVGAPGEEQYAEPFANWAGQWKNAAGESGAKSILIGLDASQQGTDLERVQEALAGEPKEGGGPLWLVFIGHGSFNGREAKFNLRGPDFTAQELAGWLEPFKRPVAIINCASASGPFINRLSAPNRVVVTATKSGYELNYARFGRYLADSILDPEADLDKDRQVSLLEAFLTASRRTSEFYETEGRLATEHALIDDNGDGLGTPSDWFRGIRAIKKAKDDATPDGYRAHQFHLVRSAPEQAMPPERRARRDELELAVIKLRDTKGDLVEDDYYRRLEKLLLDLARLYEQSDPGVSAGTADVPLRE